MEYQIIINLLDNTQNQLSKFRAKYLVEINDDSRGMCNINSRIKFKKSMLKSSLCGYNDAYILVCGIRTVTALQVGGGNNNMQRVLKNCAK